MRFGYNTNGFAHHRLEDTLVILHELGYQSVALTLDYHLLNPFEPEFKQQAEILRELVARLGLRCVIETGARFLLNSRRKHQPTLLSPSLDERRHRLDFLKRAVDLAAWLNADAVSFWSGSPEGDAAEKVLWSRLVEGCMELCDFAESQSVRLAFEPEPGMFIDTMARFAKLRGRVNRANFGLTLDLGHLHCQGETPIADQVRTWGGVLWNVHIEDMRRGVHDHLMFGEGEIDFPPVLAALVEVGYSGGVHVELSRHSHDAVNVARRSLEFLNSALEKEKPPAGS